MVSRVAALLMLPMAGLFAQAPVVVKVSASNNGQYVVRSVPDSMAMRRDHQPWLVTRGDMQIPASLIGATTIAAMDSTTVVRVEATENGRVVAAAAGRYVSVRREASGVMMQARSNIPSAPTDSFTYAKRVRP